MKIAALLLSFTILFASVAGQGGPATMEDNPGDTDSQIHDDGDAPDQKPEEQNSPEDSQPDDLDYDYFAMGSPDDDDDTIELLVCPMVSKCAKFSERVAAWLCDYTNYKIEAMKWKAKVDEFLYTCDEYDEDEPVWKSSFDCMNSEVKCRNQDNLVCRDVGMGCPVCVCSDGKYKDSKTVYKLWRDEMAMFRERFEIYRTVTETCTRSSMESPECSSVEPTEPEPTDEPGSGSESSGDILGSGRGVEFESGSGSGSGEEDEDMIVHV